MQSTRLMMVDANQSLSDRFEAIAQETQTLAFGPRALELQRDQVVLVQEFLAELDTLKAEAVRGDDEPHANTILAMELSLESALALLKMWIALKSDEGERAWRELVAAQYLCEAAIDVREQIEGECASQGLHNYLQMLLTIERFVFPPQVFMSVGGCLGFRECSICGESYDRCDHIKGRAYMGEVCSALIKKIELDEVSLVKVPANKLARITHFSDGGGRRNKMTWRLED